jgi:predicted deacylase
MQSVQANLSIELNVTCPHCEEYFDLFEVDDGRLNDDGYLMKNACPDGYWTDTHEKFKETVTCPECKEPVDIDGIAW